MRPTETDIESLEALVEIGDDLDSKSRTFIDQQWLRLQDDSWDDMTPNQWTWFDRLVERWL